MGKKLSQHPSRRIRRNVDPPLRVIQKLMSNKEFYGPSQLLISNIGDISSMFHIKFNYQLFIIFKTQIRKKKLIREGKKRRRKNYRSLFGFNYFIIFFFFSFIEFGVCVFFSWLSLSVKIILVKFGQYMGLIFIFVWPKANRFHAKT